MRATVITCDRCGTGLDEADVRTLRVTIEPAVGGQPGAALGDLCSGCEIALREAVIAAVTFSRPSR